MSTITTSEGHEYEPVVTSPFEPDQRVATVMSDREDVPAIDVDGMYRRMRTIPAQVDDARRIIAEADVRLSADPTSVLLIGVGGSAAGADLAEAAYGHRAAAPLILQRRATLPRWVGPRCLVVATSWSGNTVEAVQAARAAHQAGAEVVVIASGGELVDLAQSRSMPLLMTPGEMMPRLALSMMFALTADVLARAGVIDQREVDSELARAREALEMGVDRCRMSSPFERNPAWQVAAAIGDAATSILAVGSLRSVGRRWKEQLNENAKRWASVEDLPAAHHNALIAIQDAARHDTKLVVLEDAATQRFNDVVFGGVPSNVVRIMFAADSTPAGLLFASLVGDYASLYLAYAAGVDPTPVGIVNPIKAALAKDPGAVV